MREPYALASGGTSVDIEQQGPRLAPTAHKTACESFKTRPDLLVLLRNTDDFPFSQTPRAESPPENHRCYPLRASAHPIHYRTTQMYDDMKVKYLFLNLDYPAYKRLQVFLVLAWLIGAAVCFVFKNTHGGCEHPPYDSIQCVHRLSSSRLLCSVAAMILR